MSTTTTTLLGNFTFVDGVRNHEYELHATGCRDLKKLPLSSVRWTVDAAGHEAALGEFLQEAPQAKVFTQACCNPKRMAAAGRLFAAALPATEEVPSSEEAPAEEAPIAEVPAEEPQAEQQTSTEEVKPSKRDRKRDRKAKKQEVAA